MFFMFFFLNIRRIVGVPKLWIWVFSGWGRSLKVTLQTCGRAACAQPGARTLFGVSGNFKTFLPSSWEFERQTLTLVFFFGSPFICKPPLAIFPQPPKVVHTLITVYTTLYYCHVSHSLYSCVVYTMQKWSVLPYIGPHDQDVTDT